ncbi:hypothetical protein [Shewanella surugensis]|uniref:Uncharacterized protein n=1 Tax=Shewanella surugensis TaxID=212020 RepID=A0ABT0L642_9GAMM|nr:hypothetical protein [Shewanella surugensis]MCL1123146.1 hypothetical protein [Shewanella surugensis]
MKKSILILALFTSQVIAEDCSVEDRVSVYNTLKVKLEKMHELIPALKPSEKEFYKEVDDNLYSKPDKYKRFLTDKAFVIYSNTKVIDNHLHWVNQAIYALQTSN